MFSLNAPAALICPPDITVSCTFSYDINDLAASFGQVVSDPAMRQDIIINDPGNSGLAQPFNWGQDGVVNGSCGGMFSESMTSNLDICGNGTMTRTFTPAGATSSCSQTITIEDFSPFTASDISWPADIDINGCSGSSDTSITGRPTFVNTACKQLAISFVDETFPFDSSCTKIFRYWSVLDGCAHNQPGGGIFRDTQVIKLLDVVDPVVSSACTDTMVCVPSTSCEIALSLTATATDDCTPADLLTWTWVIDLDNDGTPDAAGDGPTVSDTYQLGTHEITWTVRDGCGNSTICNRVITVADCTAPTLNCNPSLVVQLPFREALRM